MSNPQNSVEAGRLLEADESLEYWRWKKAAGMVYRGVYWSNRPAAWDPERLNSRD